MTKTVIAAVLLTLAAPSLAFAAPQQIRGANNETSCTDSGMGMDPRCVGDVDPSGEFAATTAHDDEMMQPAPRTRSAATVIVKKQRNL